MDCTASNADDSDFIRAYVCYRLAETNGHPCAAWHRGRLSKSMSEEQLVEAERLFAAEIPGDYVPVPLSAG